MRIFLSVGEPSGDLHGANLVSELRKRQPDIECVGYGGPKMAAAGCSLHEDLTKHAIMGVLPAVLKVHDFWKLYRRADQYLESNRPDAVVLIDYPGFNWWVARSAKRHGIPVFYYGVPQMWAWGGWRVKKMRRLVDHVLCKLPFEANWFRQRGCAATYVGHPYFDEVSQRKLDATFIESVRREHQLVTILPGSRTQEVIHNLPFFLRTASRIRERIPDVQFAIASFNDKQGAIARELVRQAQLPVDVYVGRTPELIEAAHCCLACSGSVSLELLYHQKPTVILYWINWFTHFMQRFFLQVPSITLVNLLAMEDPFSKSLPQNQAPQMPFPEFVTWQDKSAEMAVPLTKWLTDESAYSQAIQRLAQLKREFAHPGASTTAATYLLSKLRPKGHSIPPPHFRVSDAA